MIDGLIRQMPNDPYFHELRGQMLFENQRVAEAIPSYERAVALLPRSGLLKTALAQALLQNPTQTQLLRAQKLLESVEPRERDGGYWRQMSMIYDRTGNIAMRSLALAAVFGVGLTLAGVAAADPWTDPNGNINLNAPRGWTVRPQQMSGGTAVLAFTPSSDCYFFGIPNPATASRTAPGRTPQGALQRKTYAAACDFFDFSQAL